MDTYMHLLITEEEKLPFYVKLVGGTKSQGPIIRPNGYPDYQWIHCIKGKGILTIDNKEFVIEKNTGIFLASNIPHEYHPIDEPWETHFIAFTGFELPDLLSTFGLEKYGVFSFNDIRFLDTLLNDIYNTAQVNSLSSGYRCSSKLYNLLIELRNSIVEDSENAENSKLKKVQQVIAFIEENYNSNPSIEEMAETIGVSSQYLCRIFKETINMRPFSYLTKYRIQKAKEMLTRNSDAKVSEIANLVGYNDESYFCAIFKKNEGITPSEFRAVNLTHRS